MENVQLCRILANLFLLGSAMALTVTVLYVSISLRHFLNLLIEGYDQSSASVALYSSGTLTLVMLGVSVISISLVGLMKIFTGTFDSHKLYLSAAITVVIIVLGFNILLYFRDGRGVRYPFQESIRKYRDVQSVRSGWDEIQKSVIILQD